MLNEEVEQSQESSKKSFPSKRPGGRLKKHLEHLNELSEDITQDRQGRREKNGIDTYCVGMEVELCTHKEAHQCLAKHKIGNIIFEYQMMS